MASVASQGDPQDLVLMPRPKDRYEAIPVAFDSHDAHGKQLALSRQVPADPEVERDVSYQPFTAAQRRPTGVAS